MKRKIIKEDAKDVILPHSQAKLDLYKNYLRNYLRVLSLAQFCTKINLYDIFCGIGMYKDGNHGSPLITNQCINEIIGELTLTGKQIKPISITINDKEKKKVENVKSLLSGQEIPGCTYKYYSSDADNMLDFVSREINSFKGTERNLVFIDPYGYSNITKDKLYSLLKNEATEIILFLPINQMYRFTEAALTDFERSCYDNLRRFITTFFPLGHKIHSDGIKGTLDFIHEVKSALTFGNKFLSCSHYIERGKGNYYALFFITSNIYGLEKMVESKWSLDPVKGKGYNQSPSSVGLFQQEFDEIDYKQQLEFLKKTIVSHLQIKQNITNTELYELTLKHEFKPSQCNTALKDLIKGRRILARDINGNLLNLSSGFYIAYHCYKDKDVKVIFSLIK
jgi:three-Cys-motif partner protein